MSSKPFRSPGPRETRLTAAAATPEASAPALRSAPRWPAQRLAALLRGVRPEMALLAGTAAVLNLWALSRNGFANDYYAAAVRSMSGSWHDFLFASMDRSGVMTVDKPPLALWVQALSARVFGFSSLSLLMPQALMGVASVLLLYDLVRRRFGRVGGFVAGITLALTPIMVAISRHNNPDALLVLCCVAALWFGLRAIEDGRTKWLVLAGACVGLGFETKMLIALVVLPGLLAAWLWIAPQGRMRALRSLISAGFAMLLLGGAWPLLVELTPASARPWVSGTSDNKVLSLIFEYNGFGRIDGQTGGPGGVGGGNVFGGTPGPLRLLNSALGGQAGWLLGFALAGAIALLIVTRLRRSDPRSGFLLALGGAFAVTAVIFSWAKGIFHPYYVSLLAPFSAALIGAFAGWLAKDLRDGRRWLRIAAAAAILAGLGSELAVLHDYPGELAWLAPLLACTCTVAALAIAFFVQGKGLLIALAGAFAALLLGPAIWAFDTLGHATSGTFPAGGPASAQTIGGPGGGPSGGFGARGFRPAGGQTSRGGSGAGRPLFGSGSGGAGGPGAGGAGGPGAGSSGPSASGSGGFGPGNGGPGAGGGAGGFGAGGAGGAVGTPLGGGAGGTQTLRHALAYVKSHGGGTLAVSSQSTAATAIVSEDANVAGIGGFSGRESDPSISWLAMEVRAGRIRWVLTEGLQQGGQGLPGDSRPGARAAMAAVRQTCTRADGSLVGGTSTTGGLRGGESLGGGGEASGDALYDCAGKTGALQRDANA